MRTHGSDLLVAALENEGVERIFGLPGEENLAVVESLLLLVDDFGGKPGKRWGPAAQRLGRARRCGRPKRDRRTDCRRGGSAQ